jgi:phage/plasmid-like protein (TIGR03299 family)
MAHDLLIENGTAAMFYVGKPPWHHLGVPLDRPATAEQAVRAGGLDWEVEKVPLYVAGGVRLHELPGKFAMVRRDAIGTDRLRPFGIVGPQYRALQNRDAFRFFDDIAGEAQAIYHTAGALGHGERIWVLAKLPDSIMVANVDAVDKYLLLSNSHDGDSAVQVKFTPIRVVCQNTLSQALRQGRTFRARHDRDLASGLLSVKEALGLIRSRFASIEGVLNRMAAVEMTQKTIGAYLAAVFPDPRDPDDERGLERADACRSWAAHLAEHGKGNEAAGVRGTLWAAYNGVAELVDHSGGRLLGPRAAKNGRTRTTAATAFGNTNASRLLESIWFGTGARTKVRAWDEAITICSSRAQ